MQIQGKNVQAYLDKSNILNDADVCSPPLPEGFAKSSNLRRRHSLMYAHTPALWLLVSLAFCKAIDHIC